MHAFLFYYLIIMQISKKKHLLDEEEISAKQLFDNLNYMNKSISPISRIQLISARRKKKYESQCQTGQEFETQSDLTDAKHKKAYGLKKIIQEQKIKAIVRNFVKKLKRNNINSSPVVFEPFLEQDKKFIDREGFQLPQLLDSIWSVIGIIQIFLLSFMYSIAIVFGDVFQSDFGISFQTISLVFYFFEFLLNLVTVKSLEGRKLKIIREIMQSYAKGRMVPDLICLLILLLDLAASDLEQMIYLRMLVLLKISSCLDKIQKLQNKLLDNFSKEQYWGLIKVFLFNFVFAHVLAICLIAMAKIQTHQNWITKKPELEGVGWFETYVWAFYWGTTIMLTVGFGDISATNYKQAICLIFLQTVSCMVLAYNINCVGNLISNIRSQDVQKNKNFKIFRKLSQKNDVPQQLTRRINNYIEQSANIKQNFNFAEENQFVSNLPVSLKADFLKESNKKIFQSLIFFRNLTEKTLLNFAEKIQMKICHPEEYVNKKDDQYGVMILKQGYLGYYCKRNLCTFHDTLIDSLVVKDKQNPLLLSLDFISKDKTTYQMKSLQYSILFYLNYNTTISILQTGELDYEHYCQLRDKSRHIVDQYQIFNCQLCSCHHTKFTCPKVHYVPLQQHIIIKYLHYSKQEKAYRINFQRKKTNYSILRMQKIDKNLQQKNKFEELSLDRSRRSGKLLQSFKQNSTKKILQSNCLISNFTVTHSNETISVQQQKNQKMDKSLQNMKTEIVKALQPHYPQQIWLLECDQAHNFKFYFTQHNASILEGKSLMR